MRLMRANSYEVGKDIQLLKDQMVLQDNFNKRVAAAGRITGLGFMLTSVLGMMFTKMIYDLEKRLDHLEEGKQQYREG